MSRDHDVLTELARELPHVEPDAERREEVRTAILVAAKAERRAPSRIARPTRWRWTAVPALAAAAALLAWIALRDRPAAPGAPGEAPKMATVEASAGAHFVHESSAADEVVRLTKGRVTVNVQKLHGAQRFRVVTSDAEVEVHGTSFDVDVVDDRLREVVVHHGLVEVRPQGRPALLLHPGERWAANAIAAAEPRAAEPVAAAVAPEPVEPAPVAAVQPSAPSRIRARPPEPEHAPQPAAEPAPTPEPEPAPEAAPVAPTPVVPEATAAERAFADAWRTLRAGDYSDAADGFARAIAEDPTGPLVEDARYWRAIAMARAGDVVEARLAMARFLAKHPTSSRAGEVSAMLGWLLLDAGDVESARRRFEAAANDADPKVRDSARAGLAAARD